MASVTNSSQEVITCPEYSQGQAPLAGSPVLPGVGGTGDKMIFDGDNPTLSSQERGNRSRAEEEDMAPFLIELIRVYSVSNLSHTGQDDQDRFKLVIKLFAEYTAVPWLQLNFRILPQNL